MGLHQVELNKNAVALFEGLAGHRGRDVNDIIADEVDGWLGQKSVGLGKRAQVSEIVSEQLPNGKMRCQLAFNPIAERVIAEAAGLKGLDESNYIATEIHGVMKQDPMWIGTGCAVIGIPAQVAEPQV